MVRNAIGGLETPEYIDKWSTRDCQNHMFFYTSLCCYENTQFAFTPNGKTILALF